jgi:ribulose-5-phosphate 4-epimerase/fuculose-1-phosphate aldolase
MPVFHRATVFGEVPVHPDPNLTQTDEQGRAVAAALGDARALLLRSHGTVIVFEDIESAYTVSVLFEENAKRLYDASLLGEPKVLEGRERDETAKRTWNEKIIVKIWNYYILKAQFEGLIS